MRIIAGRFGGRRLSSFKADHIRPTTDRIKEVIFNKLQAEIDGARVLDLFSGTGNLALEALSRGASYVEAVEKHPRSVDIIKKNMQLLEIAKDEMHLIKKDVFTFLKQPFSRGFDIILIDPPFTEAIADEVMQALSVSELSQFPSTIFIEAGKREMLREDYGPIHQKELKNYGDKSLGIYYIAIQ
ncbi:MAG: 16S rRNA (guanine(966)-N(2))-methyltransferase RsmD [Bdellovibrionaceae bacterium]|nr:16S rRNA (guanine(966)-N(2))-methyltransferase RsmD [Pseudobdellovibrionaceae bacterium]